MKSLSKKNETPQNNDAILHYTRLCVISFPYDEKTIMINSKANGGGSDEMIIIVCNIVFSAISIFSAIYKNIDIYTYTIVHIPDVCKAKYFRCSGTNIGDNLSESTPFCQVLNVSFRRAKIIDRRS